MNFLHDFNKKISNVDANFCLNIGSPNFPFSITCLFSFQTAEVNAETTFSCDLCSKHFGSKNQYENHLKSKKHKDIVTKHAAKLQVEMEKNKEKDSECTENTELPESEKRLMKDCLNMAIKSKMSSGARGKGDKPKTSNQMEVSDDG